MHISVFEDLLYVIITTLIGSKVVTLLLLYSVRGAISCFVGKNLLGVSLVFAGVNARDSLNRKEAHLL